MKKRILSLFLAGCMTLSLAACAGESSSSQPEAPEIPKDAINVPEFGLAVTLPEVFSPYFEKLMFVDSYGGYQQSGVSVTGSLVFLYQSQEVYDRVLALRESGEELGYEEYTALSLQTREFAMAATLPTESVSVFLANGGDLYQVTGYLHNDLIEEKDGYSYYFCYDDLNTENLSEQSAATYTEMWEALPSLRENLILYKPTVDAQHPFATVATTDLAGEAFTGADFANSKLTVLNVWATYCNPCIKEMPDLEKLYQEYKDKGVNVMGLCSDINAGGDFTLANRIVETTGVTYRSLVPDSVFLRYLTANIQAVPTTLFIDEKGAIVGEPLVGQRSHDQFVKELESCLEQVNSAE